MCFEWKFKLRAFHGTQCWAKETGLGLDGWSSISVIGPGEELVRMGEHSKKMMVGKWVGPHFQGFRMI